MTPGNGYLLPPWQYARHIRRNQLSVSVSSSSIPVLTANPNRIGAIFSLQPGVIVDNTIIPVYAQNVDTSTTGVKLSITIPGTHRMLFTGAGQFQDAVAGVITAVQIVHSGLTTNIAQLTSTQSFTGNIFVIGGDTIRLNVTTAQVASSYDMWIGVQDVIGGNYVTLSFQGQAVLQNGINIKQGDPPLILWKDVVGDAITEDVYGIAATGTSVLTVLDLFY